VKQMRDFEDAFGKTLKSHGEVDDYLILIFSDDTFLAVRSSDEGACPETANRDLSPPRHTYAASQWVRCGLITQSEGAAIVARYQQSEAARCRAQELQKLAELKAKYEAT
jgi:hypothetical protein